MGDADLVWVRGLQYRGDEMYALIRESSRHPQLNAADVREILGDEPPVVAYDDSGPNGALVFPLTSDGCRLAYALRDQLNDVIQRKAAALSCPAEAFPEPGAPAAQADDFAEPVGGESARVAAEEAAWEAQIRAAVTTPSALDPVEIDHHLYGGWRPLDRFVVNDPDDAARFFAASHLWPTWGGPVRGQVITRCDMHHGGHDTSAGLLIECEGLPRPIVVSPRVLSACARKV